MIQKNNTSAAMCDAGQDRYRQLINAAPGAFSELEIRSFDSRGLGKATSSNCLLYAVGGPLRAVIPLRKHLTHTLSPL